MFKLFQLGRRRLDSDAAYRELQTYIAEQTADELMERDVDLANARMLEFPVGKGGYASVFKGMVARLTAADIYRPPIFDDELSEVEFEYADATEVLPFRDASFDFVHCASLIEHLGTIDTLLSELHRVLAPGGKLLLSFPPFWSLYMVGGHGFKPYHFLGERLAVWLTSRRANTPIAGYDHDYSGGGPLYIRRVHDVKASLASGGFEVVDAYARMSVVNTMRLPGILADLLTWHACFLVEKG